MRQGHGTIQHEGDHPHDDRPEYLMGTPYGIAVDTETKGSGSWWRGEGHGAFLATVSDYDDDFLYRLEGRHEPSEDAGPLRYILSSADALIMHNASYDVHHLVAAGIIGLDELLEKQIHDTERLARLTVSMNDTPNFRLKTLGKLFVGGDAADDETEVREAMKSMGLIQRLEQKEIPDDAYYQVWCAYPEVLEKYALRDTRTTYDLYYTLLARMAGDPATERIYDLESEVAKVLIRMEHRGIATDQAKVAALRTDYTERLAAAMDELREANGGEPLDPNKRSDLLPFLEGQGVQLTDLTDTGEIRVDKWVLERHLGTVPSIGTVLEARVLEKFLSTYIGYMDGREVVNASFRPMQARTGRMSCANPNMQNIPVRAGSEVREVFVPRDGYKLLVGDYASIELRLLAHYMGDDRLWGIMESGDPFLWLGTQVFGSDDPTEWPVPRQPLKNGFYALMYGAGGPKLASTIGGGMTAQEGRELAKKIKGTLGKPYYQLQDRIKAALRKRGYVRTMGGRKLWVPYDDKGRPKDYIGLNSVIQGSAADIMKVAMLGAAEALRPFGGHLLLTVHDELVAETPERDAELALASMLDAMIEAQTLCTKGRLDLKVEGGIYANYGEAK